MCFLYVFFSLVFQVFAIDKDMGDNGRLTYSISNAGGSGQTFMIKGDTGELFVKRNLTAADENRQYVLTIRASDNGKCSRSSLCICSALSCCLFYFYFFLINPHTENLLKYSLIHHALVQSYI